MLMLCYSDISRGKVISRVQYRSSLYVWKDEGEKEERRKKIRVTTPFLYPEGLGRWRYDGGMILAIVVNLLRSLLESGGDGDGSYCLIDSMGTKVHNRDIQ